jgi:hypothetical protein
MKSQLACVPSPLPYRALTHFAFHFMFFPTGELRSRTEALQENVPEGGGTRRGAQAVFLREAEREAQEERGGENKEEGG